MGGETSRDLALRGGYPYSVGAPFDERDFQRAVESYIWSTPAVGAQALADGLAELELTPRTVDGLQRDVPRPAHRRVVGRLGLL